MTATTILTLLLLAASSVHGFMIPAAHRALATAALRTPQARVVPLVMKGKKGGKPKGAKSGGGGGGGCARLASLVGVLVQRTQCV